MKFNSQICTTKERSERLLALGLKRGTADCHWTCHSVTQTWYIVAHPEDGVGMCVPAWSLSRILELLPKKIPYESGYLTVEVLDGFHILYVTEDCEQRLVSYRNENLFDAAIRCMDFLIREGYFSKEYLEE